jgi:ABC-type multidrug transport system fused ATPase/permease subunit
MLPELNEYIINFIFKNLLKQNENNIKDIEFGKLITRISVIPPTLKELITYICVWILPRAFTIIIVNIYFLYLNWKLGIISIILLIIFSFVNIYFFNTCSPISIERHQLLENKNQLTQDKLSNSFSIYSAGYIEKEIDDYKLKTKQYTNKFKENLYCLAKGSAVNSFFNILLFVMLNAIATYLYITKKINLTSLVSIFIIIIYYIPCIVTINSSMPDLVHFYGILNAVDEFIKELYETDFNSLKNENNNIIDNNIIDNNNFKITKGNIIINNLTFGYNKNNIIFKNFYLTIKENEKVAIVGSSGNGKSSLIKLIMGYYKLADGIIFIDEIDINKYNLNDLRTQISYVNQNNKLFNLSLLENIQYGNNKSREEVTQICEKVGVSEIFKNLKEGLDTNVGIEGNNLSGGQRQMIHILRCICRKNKIVILDEPTSAIDKENKSNIIKAINELSKENTLILITHDESILNIVDRVITLDSGKIISDKYIKNS